jgi:drug/metabolite transporter (DMT)-like permease
MEGWIAIVVIGVLLFLWGYGDSVAHSQKIAERIREMLHKERLVALEKGLPAPDGDFDEALLAYLAEGGEDTLDVRGGRRRARAWATTLILAGIGWAAATIAIPHESQIGWLRDSFGFGIIPVLLGVGISIHLLLQRD